MNNKIELNNNAWFSENGSENDVIVFSRITLNRNIENTVFPANMDNETEADFYSCIKEAVDNLENGNLYNFSLLDYDDIKLLSERHYIKGGASFQRDPAVYIPEDEKFLILFNQDDHVSIEAIKADSICVLHLITAIM